MKYRPEIDGLRALAVLPVIFFHAGFHAFSGGFVGVDVFFVVSGFLITKIIVTEKENNTFSFRKFYERRARRILPVLLFILLLCMPAAWLWMFPRDVKNFSLSLMAVVSLSANLLFARQSGYFDTQAELKPLLHTWSLAVEEQYYLLFPILLVGLWRFGKFKIISTLALLSSLSLLLAMWASIHKPAYAYFLLPTRAWEISIGAIIALLAKENAMASNVSIWKQGLGIVGALMVAGSIAFYDKHTPFPSAYTLVPAIGTALILCYATSATIIGRILRFRIFVFLGLISYSMYLWHQPILAFAHHANYIENSIIGIFGLLILTVLLSYISWRWLEQPCRDSRKIDKKVFFLCIGVASTVIFAFGLIGVKTNGFEKNFIANRLSIEQRVNYQLISEHTRKDIYERMFDDRKCQFWDKAISPRVVDRFAQCYAEFGPAVILIGDSHAMNLHNILAMSGKHPFLVSVAEGGCRPNQGKKTCQYDEILEFIESNKQKIQFLYFHQSGSYLMRDRYGKNDSTRIFEDDAPFLFDENAAVQVIRYLEKIRKFVPVVWLGPFVEARIDFDDWKFLSESMKISGKALEQFRKLDAKLVEISNSYPGHGEYRSLIAVFGIDSDFIRVGDCITYNDGDHFSACGEEILATRITSVDHASVRKQSIHGSR